MSRATTRKPAARKPRKKAADSAEPILEETPAAELVADTLVPIDESSELYQRYIAIRRENADLGAQLKDTRDRLALCDQKIADISQALDNEKQANATRDQASLARNQEIVARNQEIAARNQEIVAAKQKIAALEADLCASLRTNADLRREVAAAREKVPAAPKINPNVPAKNAHDKITTVTTFCDGSKIERRTRPNGVNDHLFSTPTHYIRVRTGTSDDFAVYVPEATRARIEAAYVKDGKDLVFSGTPLCTVAYRNATGKTLC